MAARAPVPPIVFDQVDPRTRDAVLALKVLLEREFGNRLGGLYLFGSRARADFRADSDVDVAVAIEGPVDDLISLDDQLIDIAYPIELQSGLHLQLWTLETSALADPASHRRGTIAEAVRRDGIRA